MTDFDETSAPLDVNTLRLLANRFSSHPLLTTWHFEPDSLSPRKLVIILDETQYPDQVSGVRLDIRWLVNGMYSYHYIEHREDSVWQCRWDYHSKPNGPDEHLHPPPDAGENIEESSVPSGHYLDITSSVLEWVEGRIKTVHGR